VSFQRVTGFLYVYVPEEAVYMRFDLQALGYSSSS